MSDYTFPTEQKLKQKKEIDLLFAKGKWKTCDNLRIITLNLDQKPQEGFFYGIQKVGVSVSKRYFKKAVDRNRVKRLLRESYRLNKDEFVAKFGTNSLSMIFWVSPKKPSDFKTLEENFLKLCATQK
ncbi:ribonuclease P protein component [Kaistella polysaccharea]|uniref:ribonuclease P protein component n=1 Tax=Kaistella polysaccharea TaxID=2878534 RepID=UPI001CF3FEB2|nr:ribonuclease P protein component [Kaistella polysaccharea]